MTKRLVLSYVAVAVLILALLEFPLAILWGRHERDLTAEQAGQDTNALAAAAGEDLEQGRTAAMALTVRRYQAETGGEVWVVSPSGTILAEATIDADNDVTGEDRGLVAAAQGGRAVNRFGADDGRPWAQAAVPVTEDAGRDGGVVLLIFPAVSTENRIHDVWIALALFGLALVGLAAMAGLLLARSLARPLGRLESTVRRFADGDLDARAGSDDGPSEVRSLAAQFNLTADQLSELLAAQNRFVADASHQLRSPLTALRLRLENLEAAEGSPSADGISAAAREVQRLSRIVDGLLTLGRTGGEEPARQPVDLATVIRERCHAWSALAEERRVSLVPVVDASLAAARVHMAPGDLEQMIDNLLANALDASPDGGQISVVLAAPDRQSLEVRVADQGPGLNAADRQRAFDRFWQGPSVHGGHSGLGLAIVRQLAARNEARAELRPADPRGLNVVIVFPFRPAR